MDLKKVLAVSLTVAAVFLALAVESEALPNFARKMNADCSMCHSAVPKLNRFGYEFRLAGFRSPSQIGKEEPPFNLANYFAARFVEQYQSEDFRDETTRANEHNKNQLEMEEFNLFPLTGSFGKNFAAMGQLTVSPGSAGVEVENAFVRYVAGNEDGWFQTRLGIMHPLEGYGASGEPIGVSGPLFMESAAIGSPFSFTGQNQSAFEAGYSWARTGTSAAVRINNGILGNGSAAQGGDSGKTQGQPGANDKDIQLTMNQFFSGDSAVSLYGYRGVVPFPDPGTAPPPAATTRDTYSRLAAFANYFPIPGKLNLLAGSGWGYDTLGDYSVPGGNQVGHDFGYFGEANYYVSPTLGLGARYDFFDPSTAVGHNSQRAFSVFGNSAIILHELRLYAEYQHLEGEIPGTADSKTKSDTLTFQVMLAL